MEKYNNTEERYREAYLDIVEYFERKAREDVALTICEYCQESYLESEKRCRHCKLTVEQQIFFGPFTTFRYRAKIFWGWTLNTLKGVLGIVFY